MRTPPVVARVRELPVEVVDAAIAAGLLLVVGAQVAGDRPDGSLALYLAFAPIVVLPLAWRRRAPLLVAAVASTALAAQAVFARPAVTFGEFLALLVATYSVAAHAPVREAGAGAVLAFAAVGVHTYRQAEAVSTFEWVYGLVYFGGAFVLGRLVRRQVRAGEDRAARLEIEVEERARAAAAAERARIARDLHDVIAHSVGVMVVQAGAAKVALDRDGERARAPLEQVEETGREALAELRRLLGVLRADDEAAGRAPAPGLASVGGLIDQVRAAGLAVELELEGERRPLAPGVELAGYRIVQEALTNALKHANHARALVRIRFRADALEIEVEDDGFGATAENGSGHGLVGMRERTALYGGTFDAGPLDERGYRVRARFPLEIGA
jgi:signal transduction histidine kinase